MGVADVPRLKGEWGLYPKQGDIAVVPELELPPEDIGKLSNTNIEELRKKKAAAAAATAAAEGGKQNQWAQKPAGAGPFKMPRLTK